MNELAEQLEALLAEAGLDSLGAETAERFTAYLELLQRWNAKLNLTAVRDAETILSRHFVESIACARALPDGLETLLDFGTGAGLPGIPIALCCPGLSVTLAESQSKKAAFLQEAVRTLGLKARVHAGRAETLAEPFDAVTLRAVDRMQAAVKAAAGLVKPLGWLIPMTTEAELGGLASAAGPEFHWQRPIALPGSAQRVVVRAQRQA